LPTKTLPLAKREPLRERLGHHVHCDIYRGNPWRFDGAIPQATTKDSATFSRAGGSRQWLGKDNAGDG
jgi:hypothetical protein